MDILIGNLPGVNYKHEIANMLSHIDKSLPLKIKIPVTRHINKGFLCVMSIRDEKMAKRFIIKFNQKTPFGHLLHIREFIHRAYGNERREINWRKKKWNGIEERKRDRRVFSLAIQ